VPGPGALPARSRRRSVTPLSQLMARSANNCTEALLMARGFELAFLGKLVFDGLGDAPLTNAVSKPMIVVSMTITPTGRKAIAE
jgi:hypothetical protein